MKAITIENFCSIDKLKLTEIQTPTPQDDEVLIEIQYTSVNPVDWKICEGMVKNLFEYDFPVTLGWDAAGTIAACGKNVSDFQQGDAVYAYCRKATVHDGTYAEFIAVKAEYIARKPKNLTFAQAAAIPLTGLTAWQALFDVGRLKKGQSVLIHAGSGGVGSLAIQFAKVAGATVYTTASQRNHDYVKQLGANVAIDYTKDNFTSHIKLNLTSGVDLVIDAVGGQTLIESAKIVKKGGRIVSIVEKINPELGREYGFLPGFVLVRPNGEQLAEIATLIEAQKVIVPHIEEMQLADAPFALKKNQEGHTRGKIVLKVGHMQHPS